MSEFLKTIEAHSDTIWWLTKISNDLIISCSEDKRQLKHGILRAEYV